MTKLYVKTEAARALLQARGRECTPLQRQLLILCDGTRGEADLARLMSVPDLPLMLRQLLDAGLLAAQDAGQADPAPPAAAAAAAPGAPGPAPDDAGADDALDAMTPLERYTAALTLATELAGGLGFTKRLGMQLQIEKAQTAEQMAGVVDALTRQLPASPAVSARLARLRRLYAV